MTLSVNDAFKKFKSRLELNEKEQKTPRNASRKYVAFSPVSLAFNAIS